MTQNQQVVLQQGPYTDVNGNVWATMVEQAKMLVPTGFLPKAIDTPQKAVAIMLKGRELGIPPMYALSNINVIQGKPTASAELILAIIYRDQGDDALIFTETSDKRATAKYKRRTWREYQSFTFSMEDATRANLLDGAGGANWKKYPGAMLRARCISAIARLAFPDSIGGMYTPDEMGATVDYETGEVMENPIYPTAPPQAAYEEPEYGAPTALPSLEERIANAGQTERKTRSWEPTKVWPKLRKPLEKGPQLTNDDVHKALNVTSLDEWFDAGKTLEQAWSLCCDYAAELAADPA